MSVSAQHFRAAYERFLSGDPSSFLPLLDEGVTYHLPGKHLGGGTLRGRAEVLDRIRRAALACAAPPRVELIQLLAAGPFVVSFERIATALRCKGLHHSRERSVMLVQRLSVERHSALAGCLT